MKTISQSIKRISGRVSVPPAPRIPTGHPPLTGSNLLRWLRQQGARPLDDATRKRLRASGHLGMPKE